MRPALFADLELAAALQRATAERKLLVVDATAAWCGPCQMMDRTTWVDADVIAWLRDHAVTIQLDVDARNEVARGLQIQAMPTIIAFADGKEFDRVVGAKKPKELLAWLEGVVRGETSLAVLERSVRGEPADMRARFDFARELARAGRHEQALVEFLWLWDHMLEHDRALSGVRLSYLAGELEMLAKVYAPAREAIVQLRDRGAPPVEGPIDAEKFADWTCLNRVLGEQQRTLAWYDALPATRRSTLGPLLQHHIIPRLIEAERWAEAGALYEDPLATINRETVMPPNMDELPAQLVEYIRSQFREHAAQLVRALSAAGRAKEADSIALRAREIDPSAEMATALERAAGAGPQS